MASSSKATTASSGKQPVAPRSPESYSSLARRNAAAEILQSYEKLSWYSFQRCESLTQTRLHFLNIIAGLTEADEASLVDWPTDNSSRKGDKGSAKGKGKKRKI